MCAKKVISPLHFGGGSNNLTCANCDSTERLIRHAVMLYVDNL